MADESIENRLDQISAQLSLIQSALGLQGRRPVAASPWLPLNLAADHLHFTSTKALRGAISRGRIPPQFVRSTTVEGGTRKTTYVDVEGFASHLRNK